MPVLAVLAVIASFIAILVGICVALLIKYLDVLISPRNYIFLFRLSSSKRDLRVNMEDLRLKKEDIDKKIEEGERQSKIPVRQVEGWKRDVVAIMPEILKFLGERHNRGFFFNRSNHSARIKCADYLERVKDLLKRGEFDVVTKDDDVSNFPIPTSYEVPGSLELKCQKAVEFVLNDNSNVIGIWGMGGVGKTTLLKKVRNLCIRPPIFGHVDHVIWTVASREQSNISKIQSEIVNKLKLNETSDIQSQASIIHNFLENKNFLLFIDDLWEAVDLLEVGIPNTSDRKCAKKRKVVFTTRQTDVCHHMKAKETIKVDCLNWEESWLLFKEKVGEQLIQSHPDISKLAEDVANECKGLPLALITIGRAMSTKKNSNEWKLALSLMRKSQAPDISGTKIHEMQRILKISYDFLDKDHLKKCFLSISMWPEDFQIRQSEIIECWVGLDIIHNFESMEDAYLIGFSYIGILQAACLLEDPEDEEHFNYGQHVIMHDVLRDLSIWIASDCGENKNKWITKAGIRLNKGPNIKLKWSEAECISLMRNQITELPLGITRCPDLHTLMLTWNNLTCEYILKYFHNFGSLKYLDLYANRLNGFPEIICTLTKLQYLNLSANNIDNIPRKLSNLKELKYLKLGQNPIRNVPKGVFSELGKLLLLDLFCAKENIYGPDVEELKCLEKQLLYLGIIVRSEEELNKLMLLSDFHIGALCIKDLNNTSFHFVSIIPKPCTSNLPYCLQDLRITHSHHSLLEIVFDKVENHDYSLNMIVLSFINLTALRRIIWRGLAPKKLFPILQEINFKRCNVLEHVTWIIHLPSLKFLRITECNSMIIAFSNKNYEVDSSDSTFPSLKSISFCGMSNLQKLSSYSPAFPQLQILLVDRCPLLKTLERELIASPKIQEIGGRVKWWDKLEWENDNSRSHFSQFFQGH